MRRLKAIDLFAGCGGLTLGLKRAGFRVVGAVEIDKTAADTYAKNHPEVRLWTDDIKKITTAEVRRKLNLKAGQLDLLAGCPPCQGFSSMRRLNGGRIVRDRKNALILDFLRMVRGLCPKAVMLENVPHLAHSRRFARFCRQLRQLGYNVDYAVLDAADYGVPQRRRRVICFGLRSGEVDFASPSRGDKTVVDAIGHLPLPRRSHDPIHNVAEHRSKQVRDMIRRIPKNGGSRSDLGAKAQLRCHRDCDGFKDVYGRMAWRSIAPTITTGCFNPSKGRFLHPSQNRCITMREAALLQTFPRRYYFPADAGKVKLAVLIGNALPPEFIRRHAVQLKKSLTHR